MPTIADYARATEPLLQRLVRHVDYRAEPDLSTLFATERRIVHVWSHAAAPGWVPLPLVAARVWLEHGGGDRRQLGVFHRWLYRVPGGAALGRYVAQLDHAPTFDELVAHFASGPFHDLAVFPEGDQCLFGDPSTIRPFRSPRFVELALRADADLLLMVHRGTEVWSRQVGWSAARPFMRGAPRRWRRLAQSEGGLALPLPPSPIERLTLRALPWQLSLRASDLSDDKRVRRIQLWREAHAIRAEMSRMLVALDIELGDRRSA